MNGNSFLDSIGIKIDSTETNTKATKEEVNSTKEDLNSLDEKILEMLENDFGSNEEVENPENLSEQEKMIREIEIAAEMELSDNSQKEEKKIGNVIFEKYNNI